jgi:hypothetical protein
VLKKDAEEMGCQMNFKAGDVVELLSYTPEMSKAAEESDNSFWGCGCLDVPSKAKLVGTLAMIDEVRDKLARFGDKTWPLAALKKPWLWIPQVGDIIKKNPEQAFANSLAEITDVRKNGSFEYRVFGTQEFAGCDCCHATFILRPGDKVKLLPFKPWEENCSGSFNHVATVSGVKLEPLSFLDQWHILHNPMTMMVSLECANEANEPWRWPLSAVERIDGEIKAEPQAAEPSPVIGRRLCMDMLPAEREQYEGMMKRREVKPLPIQETESDIRVENDKINVQIENKRKVIMQLEAEIDDLEEDRMCGLLKIDAIHKERKCGR